MSTPGTVLRITLEWLEVTTHMRLQAFVESVYPARITVYPIESKNAVYTQVDHLPYN